MYDDKSNNKMIIKFLSNEYFTISSIVRRLINGEDEK